MTNYYIDIILTEISNIDDTIENKNNYKLTIKRVL